MTKQKIKILVVDSDEEVLDLLESVLADEHLTVLRAKTGSVALKKIFQEVPDLMLLDLDAPSSEAREIHERLKRDVLYKHIPILFMTDTRQKPRNVEAREHAILNKPFESDQVRDKVHHALQNYARDIDAHPKTRLPGQASFLREIDCRIARQKPFVALYLDITHFTSYNDRYGYEQGDEVIASLARSILEVLRVSGGSQDFVAHLSGDDFVLITLPELADRLAGELIQRFEENRMWFYNEKDRRNGWTLLRDRRGKESRGPLMGLAVAGVSSNQRTLTHPAEVSKIARELLRYAKSTGGSFYVRDRRTVPEVVLK